MRNIRRWLSGATISISLFVIGVVVLIIASLVGHPVNVVSGSENNSSTTTAAAPTGCTTWATAPSDYTNNRWFADGIAEIKNATTPKEATNAAHVWLAEVRKDPNLLAGAAKYFLGRDVDKASLSVNSCATDTAVQLVTELELAIGQAKIVAGDAPGNGYNSGVSNGVVVGSASAGINGDRKAIQITLADGRVIWIMARCGNIVTIGLPPVPSGPTDQPPVCPPGTTGTPPNCLTPKNHANDVTPPQGVTPQPAGVRQPVAPAAPAAPMNPAVKPGSDTGAGVPVQGATPAPAPVVKPVTDPAVAPAPANPGTTIVDPG